MTKPIDIIKAKQRYCQWCMYTSPNYVCSLNVTAIGNEPCTYEDELKCPYTKNIEYRSK